MKKGANVLLIKLALLVFVRDQETSPGVFDGQSDIGTGVRPGAGSYIPQTGRELTSVPNLHQLAKESLRSAFISNTQ